MSRTAREGLPLDDIVPKAIKSRRFYRKEMLGFNDTYILPEGYFKYDFASDNDCDESDADWLVNWVWGFKDGVSTPKEWLLDGLLHAFDAGWYRRSNNSETDILGITETSYHFFAYRDKTAKGACNDAAVYLDLMFELPEGHRIYSTAFAAADEHLYFKSQTGEVQSFGDGKYNNRVNIKGKPEIDIKLWEKAHQP